MAAGARGERRQRERGGDRCDRTHDSERASAAAYRGSCIPVLLAPNKLYTSQQNILVRWLLFPSS